MTFSIGYFSKSGPLAFGSFGSLLVGGGVLILASATNGISGFAAVLAQPQNQFSISFIAAAVPEPESYALLLAGLAVIGTILRRRMLREV